MINESTADLDLLYQRFSHKDTVIVQDTLVTVSGHINFGYEHTVSVWDDNGNILFDFCKKDVVAVVLMDSIVGELLIKFKDGNKIRLR